MFIGLGVSLGFPHQRASSVMSPYLDGVIDSVCCDLDATIEASYAGSGQTWANLIAAPADGAEQTDYDFQLGPDGTTSNDPSFVGTAGDSAAYFDFGNTSWFSLKAAVAAMPPLFRDMHKNAQSWWIAIHGRTPAAYTFTHDAWFGITGNAWEEGIRASVITNINAFRVNRVSAAPNGQQIIDLNAGSPPIPVSTDFVLIITHEGTTHNWRSWYNSDTATDSGTTADIIGENDAGAATNRNYALGAGASTGDNAGNAGRRYYGFAAGNDYIDDSAAALIRAHILGRRSA